MPPTLTLGQVAAELNADSLRVLKAAKKHMIGDAPTQEQIQILKREISGYYDLSDRDIRALEDFVNSEGAQEVLKETLPVIDYLGENEFESYLNLVAGRLFEGITDEELKNKVRPETLRETIINLGVITVYRNSTAAPEYEQKIPLHLLKFDRAIGRSVIKNQFVKTLETIVLASFDDFDTARETVRGKYQGMLEESRDTGLESAIQDAYRESNDMLNFGVSLWRRSYGSGTNLTMHQIVRIYTILRDNVDRIACNDVTKSGKTYVSVVSKGLYDEKLLEKEGRKAKMLLIANNEAVEDIWTEDNINPLMDSLKLPRQKIARITSQNLGSLLDYDIITVNYEKLSISPETERNRYLQAILSILPNADLTVVDEFHRLKNIEANRTRASIEIIEGTKGKKFLMLSATDMPTRPEDIGFALYMFNPDKYGYYATIPFDYEQDPFAIMNVRNSGRWFSITREEIKIIFGLPDLISGMPELGIENPYYFELSEKDAREYLEIWKDDSMNVSKIHPLGVNLLQASMSEIERICTEIRSHDPEAQIAIYSHYVEGFSEEMKERLERIFPNEVGMITGLEKSIERRMEEADRFRNAIVRISVNSTATASESINLTAGQRNIYIIKAQPPITSGNEEQITGRFYGKGQEGTVAEMEMIPRSNSLNEAMQEEKERREQEGITFRKSWRPGTVFEDTYAMRQERRELIDRMKRGLPIENLIHIANIPEESEEERAYPTLIPRERESTTNDQFNNGLKRVVNFIGKPVDSLAGSRLREYLIESYSRKDWDATSSADTNRAISEVIEAIERETGRAMNDILDWGSGPACLARITRRAVKNLDALEEMIEIGKARALEMGIYNKESIDDYFAVGNARSMPFADASFDFVCSSYSLQYNAQGYQHRRDAEEILKETNRVMRDNAYGAFALPNQATTQDDIKALTKELLPRYGFKAMFSDYITGHAVNPETNRENKVFHGFYLIVYQKEKDIDYSGLIGEDDIFIFAPYKKMGIGGIREVQLGCGSPQSYKREKIAANIFKASGADLADILKQAMA